jgi:hypothetical protein
MNLKDLETVLREQLGGVIPKSLEKTWKTAFESKGDHAQVQGLKDLATAIGNGQKGITADRSLQKALLKHVAENYEAGDNKTMYAQTMRDLAQLDKWGVKEKVLTAPKAEEKPPAIDPAPKVEDAPKAAAAPAVTEEAPAVVTETPKEKDPPMNAGKAQVILDSAAYMTGDEFAPETGIYTHDGNPDVLIHIREHEGKAVAREVDLATEPVDKAITDQTVLVASRVNDPVRKILGSHDEENDVARATLRNHLYVPTTGFALHDLLTAPDITTPEAEAKKVAPAVALPAPAPAP